MKVNGSNVLLNDLEDKSIEKLLSYLNININRVVIELNGNIIEKEKIADIILNESDKIEIIHFVGGGS
ncbi:MAG: sulfur carrier protein ThiS [Spirochaetia bacterium]|nr:sulfur carrier protein ThiS [Spirochaetia bacterium]